MIEVDLWVRGTLNVVTRRISSVPSDPARWSDADVQTLLTDMLLLLNKLSNPAGDAPDVSLRGFSWIVNPYEKGGVLVHLEMQLGTASAGPIAIDEPTLTAAITRVMSPTPTSTAVH